MPNPDYNDMNGRKQGPVKAKPNRAGAATGMPEKTSGFPGVPGKTQSKNRSGGVYKCKVYADSEGL